MKLHQVLARALIATTLLAAVGAAQAITTSLSAGTSGSQLGRLSRNSIPQDFVAIEPFPGVINPTVRYFYAIYALDVGSTNFLNINFDSVSPNTFISAYQTSYRPNSLATSGLGFETNWLGDAGSSGNFFGVDPVFFNITAMLNSTVLLIVNNTAANGVGVGDPFTLTVFGYPDNTFNADPVELTPRFISEPSTLLLLGVPLVLWVNRRAGKRRDASNADRLAEAA